MAIYFVKIKYWNSDGMMEIEKHQFPSYKHAHDYASEHHKHHRHNVRIFNEFDMLLHTLEEAVVDFVETYA